MKKHLYLSIFIWLIFVKTALGTDYYASNSGSGSTCSQGTPGSVDSCMDQLSAGDTLYLADGTYTGADYMINFDNGTQDGSEGSPITIIATNDGEVTIDGEDARIPISIGASGQANDWIVVQGVNAHSSSGAVVVVAYSSNVSIKRVVAWDAPSTGNVMIFHASNSTNTLFEDCAGWGYGRKIFSLQSDTNTTFRRCFGRFTNHQDLTFLEKETFTISYNSSGTIIENSIGTWDEISGSNQTNMNGIVDVDSNTAGTNFKILGSIFYFLSNQTGAINNLLQLGRGYGYDDFNDVTVKDVLVYTNKSGYIAPFYMNGQDTTLTLSYLTAIGGDGESASRDYSVGTNAGADRDMVWNGTGDYVIVQDYGNYGVDEAATYNYIIAQSDIGGAIGPWEDADPLPSNYSNADPDLIGNCGNLIQYGCTTNRPEVSGSDVGAKIQYRYVDGVITGYELWPWPMNARIAAAMVASGYDVQGGLDGSNSTNLTKVIFELGGGTEPSWGGQGTFGTYTLENAEIH